MAVDRYCDEIAVRTDDVPEHAQLKRDCALEQHGPVDRQLNRSTCIQMVLGAEEHACAAYVYDLAFSAKIVGAQAAVVDFERNRKARAGSAFRPRSRLDVQLRRHNPE